MPTAGTGAAMANSTPGLSKNRPVTGLGPESYPCRVPECVRPAQNGKQGLCRPHASRYYRTGSVGSAAIRPRRTLPIWTPP